ncbi:MAG: hypothetical protein KJO20_13020 [Eudoraea sp.]|nr:hypothetical protein [Eudoraea sp.]
MKGKRCYTWISTVFLFLLLGAKGLDYHSLSHSPGEDALQCELCTFMVQQETLDYNSPASSEIPLPKVYLVEDQEVISTLHRLPGRLTPDSLLSRPPPVWV